MKRRTKERDPIRLAIMIGSDSDLAQCVKGLAFLEKMEKSGKVLVKDIITNSIQRNTKEVLENLESLRHIVDALIIGAGWANQLTGTADAYLRYALNDLRIPVFGVAFEGTHDQTEAAVTSILYVPGTQVIFYPKFTGSAGFLHACKFVSTGKFPKIKPVTPKKVVHRTLSEALEAARAAVAKK